ncbi:sirohydrochlorin chelatase [Peribacillus alkalitolerans]|uniref:sirohydrochlorin chelatase n=1 Tax=Peribacillus alkalitolerans TaxID=1550385 RepID=UPI0013D0B0DA|nr:sirohydrochlorin chelatase [Peribacillus alkalitolerans]
MQAILYVCHGSRLKTACEEAISFIERCQKHITADIHQICFLELANPSIEEGFGACVKKGATHIAVVPLLLLTAVHAKKDIPDELRHLVIKYPNVTVTYGRPIGVHEKLAWSVIDRIKEKQALSTDSTIVLIGRGSTDPEVERDLRALGNLVRKHSGISDVRTCFLTAAKPSFSSILSEVSLMKNRNIIFVPYLLFTGLLMKEIEKNIATLSDGVTLCRYLGCDSKVEEVFIERVIETLVNKNYQYSFSTRGLIHAAIND